MTKAEIVGDLAQVVRVTMDRGDSCWSSRGGIVSHDAGIRWNLKIPGGAGGAASRALSGEGISLTYVQSDKDGAQVVFGSNQPGKIELWDLAEGPVMTTRGSFAAAWGPNVNIDVTVARKAGAAVFGGAGLFLQKISGQGVAMVHGSGDFIDRRLESGETILVSTGNLAAFSGEVDYDIQTVSGCRQKLFGGEGLFMTRLTGPGRVLLQTLKRTFVAGAGG